MEEVVQPVARYEELYLLRVLKTIVGVLARVPGLGQTAAHSVSICDMLR
jgi:hypothetical protein